MIKGVKWGLIVAILVAIVWWLNQEKAIEVTWIAPELGAVETIVANTRSGTVEACQRAKMSFPIGGQIERIYVKEGDLVDKDTPLMALWQQDRLAKVSEAKALINARKSQQQSVCITANNDQKNVIRIRQLLKQKLTSQEKLDNSLTKAQASEAACLSAQSEVDVAEAMLATAKASLAQTELYAPFNGMVAEITGELGEYATPSPPGIAMPPAIDILTHDCHYITAPIDEVDAGQLAVGMPVKITIDAFDNLSFEGAIQRISPYVQDYAKQARTVDVDVVFSSLQNLDGKRLLTGYSADIAISVEKQQATLRLPSDVIIDGQQVYVLGDDGIISLRKVKLGLTNWQYSQITDGLGKSDKVISSLAVEGLAEGVLANGKPQVMSGEK